MKYLLIILFLFSTQGYSQLFKKEDFLSREDFYKSRDKKDIFEEIDPENIISLTCSLEDKSNIEIDLSIYKISSMQNRGTITSNNSVSSIQVLVYPRYYELQSTNNVYFIDRRDLKLTVKNKNSKTLADRNRTIEGVCKINEVKNKI